MILRLRTQLLEFFLTNEVGLFLINNFQLKANVRCSDFWWQRVRIISSKKYYSLCEQFRKIKNRINSPKCKKVKNLWWSRKPAVRTKPRIITTGPRRKPPCPTWPPWVRPIPPCRTPWSTSLLRGMIGRPQRQSSTKWRWRQGSRHSLRTSCCAVWSWRVK